MKAILSKALILGLIPATCFAQQGEAKEAQKFSCVGFAYEAGDCAEDQCPKVGTVNFTKNNGSLLGDLKTDSSEYKVYVLAIGGSAVGIYLKEPISYGQLARSSGRLPTGLAIPIAPSRNGNLRELVVKCK
jgi:hypothetical protein